MTQCQRIIYLKTNLSTKQNAFRRVFLPRLRHTNTNLIYVWKNSQTTQLKDIAGLLMMMKCLPLWDYWFKKKKRKKASEGKLDFDRLMLHIKNTLNVFPALIVIRTE